MAAIVTQDPTGGIASVLHRPRHAQVPQHPGPLPSRILHPEEHLQLNQPFYVPTVQPFFPYQWSMSTPYVPYGGFHGLGYGTMMPPSLLPLQCLEVPGYMIPQTQLHMMDYRRMTPHVAPTIAHQTRHSHFQNGVPPGRVMVSSEVQTEPLCRSIDSHERAISHNCSESGRGTDSPVSTSPSTLDNKSVTCPEGTSMLTQNYNATNAISTTDLSAVPKSEILQAEHMQIKCDAMLSGRKNFQNKDNMELASHNETDLLQCSLGSVQSSGDVVLCAYQSLAFRKDEQRVEAEMLRYSKHRLPACTEVTVLRTSPSCRTLKAYPKPIRSVINQGIKAKKNSDMPFQAKSREDGNTSNNIDFKILRLPFDMENHNQPCQLEASIWSVESLIPYVPSTEWMTDNGLLTPPKPLSPLNEHSDVIAKPNYVPEGKNLQPGASVKYHGRPCQLEASIWSVESLMPYVPSSEWMVENGCLTPQKPLSPQIKSSDLLSKQNQSSTGIPAEKNLQTGASTKHESFNSLVSRSPYRPSTSWLADFGNVYYYSKLPVVQQHPDLPEKQQPKMSLAISLEPPPLRNGKNTKNQSPAIGISDQKHCSLHTCKCKAKRSLRLAGSSVTCDWVSHSTLQNKLRFCTSCRYVKGKDHRKPPFSDGFSCKREETTDLNNFYMKRATEGFHGTPKMTSGSHLSKCCAASLAKPSEKTGLCEDCQCLNPSPAQDKCGDIGWRIWEKSEEDWINNPNQRMLQTLQKNNPWKASMQGSKTERRIQKKERKAYSQEITQEEDTMFIATGGQCAHPMES
ncbi:uncharacterized protein buc2l [Sinocyclocheilus grahami]|uniref:uncharacterized protein buc2l n=1 Tax=Sinocyclocheilus grahami TaxID=75366 RepID=UPI0007ACC082|nr:PREDICTED: uncharacterized protein LOC107578103 [Sinocyclocheilus grahami]XP_016119578.1 PREDICTED: uncharacterized protein LOC107578103 [Sinocyclocheilus grahami]